MTKHCKHRMTVVVPPTKLMPVIGQECTDCKRLRYRMPRGGWSQWGKPTLHADSGDK